MVIARKTVADLLRYLEPELSKCLGRKHSDRLGTQAAALGLNAFHAVGFEVRLDRDDDPIDLSLLLAPPAALRALADFAAGDPELSTLIGLLARKQLVTPRGHWIEYDSGTPNGQRPSLFARPADGASTVALAEALGSPSATHESLRQLVDACGEEHRVFMLGSMRRAEYELRVLLSSRTGHLGNAFRVLERCGWEVKGVEEAFAPYVPLGESWSLALGFAGDGTLLGRVGIELHLPDAGRASAMLIRLEADGLALAGSSSTLTTWHGHREDPNGEVAPSGFREASALTGGRAVPVVARAIAHVKLAVHADNLRAKAYLCARPVLAGR